MIFCDCKLDEWTMLLIIFYSKSWFSSSLFILYYNNNRELHEKCRCAKRTDGLLECLACVDVTWTFFWSPEKMLIKKCNYYYVTRMTTTNWTDNYFGCLQKKIFLFHKIKLVKKKCIDKLLIWFRILLSVH